MKRNFLILRAPEGSEGPTGAGSNGNKVPGDKVVKQPETDVPPEEDPNKTKEEPKTDVPPEEDPNKTKEEPKTDVPPEENPNKAKEEPKTDVPPEEDPNKAKEEPETDVPPEEVCPLDELPPLLDGMFAIAVFGGIPYMSFNVEVHVHVYGEVE